MQSHNATDATTSEPTPWQLPVEGQEYELNLTIDVGLTTYGPERRSTQATYVLGGAGHADGTWRLWCVKGEGPDNQDLIDIENQTGPNPMHHLQALLCGHLVHDGARPRAGTSGPAVRAVGPVAVD